MTYRFPGSISLVLLTAGVISSHGHAFAEDTGTASPPALVISATRHEMPQSQVSNDITVITEEEIAHLPVHDLSEALNYATGLDIQRGGGPGSFVTPSIQGSDYRHVKVLVDGIPLEMLSEGLPDLSVIPLENVKRVEIMKGSASSVWGASLGGVINIVTKAPTEKTIIEGGASIGENSTHRFNAAVSGTEKGVGYLLSGSKFETDGFSDHQRSMIGNFYGKATKQFNAKLNAEASYAYMEDEREDSGWIWKEETFEQRGRILLTYQPQGDDKISLSLYDRIFDSKMEDAPVIDGIMRDKEHVYGATIESVWKHSTDAFFVAGAEGSHGDLKLKLDDWQDYEIDKRAVFVNETYSLERLSVNAGLRYDDDYVFGSELSPSAGIVYSTSYETLFRFNAARGFTPPPLTYRYYGSSPNKDLNAERAWTYQAGVESSMIPGLWGKITLYRANVTDAVKAIYDMTDPVNPVLERLENISRVRRQGLEAEVKTKEYRGLILSYSYNFNDSRDLDNDETVKGIARITHNAGIDYKGPFDTRTTLNGHYVWWNADPAYNAKDKTWIWDAKVSKYFAKWKYALGEVFVSVHNITDEEQFWVEFYPNPGRWVEAGISLTTF